MNAVVTVTGNTVVTMSTKEIADLTGKLHKNVLADTRKMLESLGKAAADFSATAQTPGPNNSVREIEVYKLPRDLTETLITGYNIPLRHKVVVRLRELEEAKAKPVNLSDASALRGLLLGYTEQVLQLEHKITEDAPKVEFYDNVAVAVGTQSVQDVAKEFGLGAVKFYKLLRDEKILMDQFRSTCPKITGHLPPVTTFTK